MNDVGNLKKLNDEIFEKNAEGFCQLMNIQPENVKRCKDCKVNLFCWSCLEDIELHIKDEAAFLRRCENKKKISLSNFMGLESGGDIDVCFCYLGNY